MLKLMYITNDPRIAEIAQSAGVDRIFVDMEYIGKADRQGGMDTVQSHHTVEDVKALREVLTTSELMVRINPWHEATDEYCSSEDEINAVIEAGADVIMLPYFKTAEEVSLFVDCVNGRSTTFPLLETSQAADQLDHILALHPDELHIGINDLSISMGKPFMFELFADGTVERIMDKCHLAGIPCGIGGIARLGEGMLPAEYIIREHYRMGSQSAILSRSFCNTQQTTDLDEIRTILETGVAAIRELEAECEAKLAAGDTEYFTTSKETMAEKIAAIVEKINSRK